MIDTPLSLSALNSAVSDLISESFCDSYWVCAEISSVNVQQKGHCYLELIEKAPKGDAVVARAKATIWAARYQLLAAAFREATGTGLQVGMQVLLAVTVQFHEVYGYSLDVVDIDPTYTIGEQARKKQLLLQRLSDEGWVERGHSKPLPLFVRRIALISSATAAGYGDFCNELDSNVYGYRFDVRLFQAAMQGDDSADSIVKALERIAAEADAFDLVAIVRGGGSTSELSCFDHYGLALAVAGCPLPVLSGIGHDRDRSAVDEVATLSLKTPTAVAQWMVQLNAQAESRLDALVRDLHEGASKLLSDASRRLEQLASELPMYAGMWLGAQQTKLDFLAQQISALSPQTVLSRGYAMVESSDGLLRCKAADIKLGESLILKFSDGEAQVEVKRLEVETKM